jgi:hypothetical protein
MANIKFSAFTAEADIVNFDDIVGYQGALNKKITPANLATSLEPLLPSGPFLPLAGGTMTGVAGVVVPDNFKWNFGTGSDLEIYHDGANSYIDEAGTGNMYIRCFERFRLQDVGTGNPLMHANVGGNVELYYNAVLKLETTATGTLTTGDSDMTGGISRTLGARVMQHYEWTAGNPVAFTNWTNGVFSNLPFDPTPSIDVTDCNVANYGWVCTNAAGGAAGQEATFTLGAAGAGTWRIKVIANWYDQTANVITEGRLNINGTSYEVIAEAAVESTTDKIYYGEKIVTLVAGDTVQFGMIFTGGAVNPFPSVGTTGNSPNAIYFEKVL